MDWHTMLIIGLSASAGALAGVVIGWLVAPLFGKKEGAARRNVARGAVLTGAIIGYATLQGFIRPLVEPRIEAYESDPVVDLAADEEAVEEPEIPETEVQGAVNGAIDGLNDPFFVAVLDRENSRAQQVRTQLASAYRTGGEPALLRSLMNANREVLRVALPYYMARAEENDLIAAVEQIRSVIDRLAERDPMLCHTWLYGAMTGTPFDFEAYLVAVGPEAYQALQSRLADVVRNADDILPDYDQAHAMAVLDAISQTLNAQMGDEKVGLILYGQQPESMADARLACLASGDYYDLILEDEKAADVLRHRYSGGHELQ